jgi:hypothetical protein
MVPDIGGSFSAIEESDANSGQGNEKAKHEELVSAPFSNAGASDGGAVVTSGALGAQADLSPILLAPVPTLISRLSGEPSVGYLNPDTLKLPKPPRP